MKQNINKPYVVPEYPSTVNNTVFWKLWHSINYMIGGITFLFGSVAYWPSIDPLINGDTVAGWLYTIGSACFLLADLTEWNHFRFGCIGKLISGRHHDDHENDNSS